MTLGEYEAVCKKYAARKNEQIKVSVAGHPDGELFFMPFSQCGEIVDGVSLRHGNHGGWVISFESLKRMYESAQWFRRERESLKQS